MYVFSVECFFCFKFDCEIDKARIKAYVYLLTRLHNPRLQ